MTKFDLVVIGAGPGGYTSAAFAAKTGLNTAIIESRELGGTCLNRGCIPTKTFIHCIEEWGTDIDRIQEHKANVVESLQKGVGTILKKGKVAHYSGLGTIVGENQVKITGADGTTETIEADKILICTGSVPAVPPIPGHDLPNVITSDELLDNRTIYKKLIIIGGGVIGAEFASIYRNLGSEVVVIEALDRLLANLDKEISQSIKMLFKKRGIEAHTSSMVQRIEQNEDGTLKCVFTEKDAEVSVDGDAVLMSVGRRPNTNGLLDGVELDMERGRILVNETYQTNIPNIYAIGDVIGGIQLAHVSVAEGINAVCHMVGEEPEKALNAVPSCIYTDPEIAQVGMSADEAKALGDKVKVVKYPMSANGKSLLSMQERGFIKIVADAQTGKVLGGMMMCARATDMISVITTAVVNELTVDQMKAVIFPHPTFAEGIGETFDLF